MMIVLSRVRLTQPTSSKQPSNLLMYIPKWVMDMRLPFLTTILQSITFYQCSTFINLAIMFSYNLIATTINLKWTFNSFNIFQRLVEDTLSKACSFYVTFYLYIFFSKIILYKLTKKLTNLFNNISSQL